MKDIFNKIIILIVIIFVVLIITLYKNQSIQEDNIMENEEISNIKNEIGVQGQDDIYEIIEDIGNQQILNVKEDVKFKVALAGLLKKSKPNFEEIDNIIEQNKFTKTGIYVDFDSRDKFLDLIGKFTGGEYLINESGYLELVDDSNVNEKDELLNKLNNSKDLFIIDFSNECYIVDDVTGEIVDYPFGVMDPYQICQIYKQNNQSVVFVNSNLREKLSDEEIFCEILALL